VKYLDDRRNPVLAAEARNVDIYVAVSRARFDRVHDQLVFASHAICRGHRYFVIPMVRQ
jgi:hypothetical protein